MNEIKPNEQIINKPYIYIVYSHFNFKGFKNIIIQQSIGITT